MAIDEVNGQAWTRRHDNSSLPVVASAPRTLYPKSLEELIHICAGRTPSERIQAGGSLVGCGYERLAFSSRRMTRTTATKRPGAPPQVGAPRVWDAHLFWSVETAMPRHRICHPQPGGYSSIK